MRYSDWVLHIFVEEIQCTSITNPIDASINMSCFYDDIFMPQKKNLGALLSPSGIEDEYS